MDGASPNACTVHTKSPNTKYSNSDVVNVALHLGRLLPHLNGYISRVYCWMIKDIPKSIESNQTSLTNTLREVKRSFIDAEATVDSQLVSFFPKEMRLLTCHT